VTRIALVDPQPATRAGLAVLLRGEPGLVPVGAATGASDAPALLARERPDVVLLEPFLLDGDGIALCRRLTAEPNAPRVLLYTSRLDDELHLLARVAGARGIVDKTASPEQLFEVIRRVERGESALPPLTRAQLDAAAHRVDPDDLAVLAMLVDGTPAADVAATLRLGLRPGLRRIERVIGRLRGTAPGAPRPAA
jgi:DNA-binding NarL/FixJ family response regulator